MADDDNAQMLRRSLDAVDRTRRLLFFGIGALALLIVMIFFHGVRVHDGSDTTRAVLAHYFILLIWVTGLALVVIIQIASMTRRILRAIELTMRK